MDGIKNVSVWVVPADSEDSRPADAEEVRQDGGRQKTRRGQQLNTVVLLMYIVSGVL